MPSAPARALLTAAIALFLFPASCAPSRGASSPPQATLQNGTPLVPGTPVLVNRDNRMLPARVVRPVSADRVVVHYEGYGNEWDEAVPVARLHPAAPVAPFQPGEKVLVRAHTREVLGTIVQQLGPAAWRVQYDGYAPGVGETVGADRLRRPHNGPTAFPPGQAVVVVTQGYPPMPAKVLAATAPDRWLVRFDGFGAEHDQELGADRVRAAPPAPADPAAAAVSAAPNAPEANDAKDSKDARSAVPSDPPKAGDAVLVSVRGALHPATVVSVGAGSLRVRYDAGTPQEEDVAAERVVHRPVRTKGQKLRAQQPVYIEWHGMMFPGKVIKEHGKGLYRVRYEGFPPETDEVVTSNRIFPRP